MERHGVTLNLHEQTSLIRESKSHYSSVYGLDESGCKSPKKLDARDSPRTLGTFGGVFAPVALSQFSTLLFLRIGFIIGSVGLYGGFGTLALAYGILLTTILSISAISTNGAIEAGGVYYMISRILGPEFGGSIGVLFVCANILGSGLYNIGCIEGILQSFGTQAGDLAIAKVLPESEWHRIGYRSAVNAFNFIICCIGAGMFTKTTVALFFIVFTCAVSLIVSFLTIGGDIEIPIPEKNALHFNTSGIYTGLSVSSLFENLYPEFTTDYTTHKMVDFATVFSVIFSGVTGIMNGANLSGELKNPGFSIPTGTLSAATFTFSVYAFLFVLTAASCSRFLLQNNYSFLMGINVWGPFVTIGVITATMSASLSKMIGASRILAAIVKDNLFGRLTGWMGRMSYGSNPLGSVFVSALLVQGMILIGQLNTIAKFASIFFLMSHCATNIACFFLEWASAPNFRPTFRYFSWWTAFVGILANGSMMFVISPLYSIICVMICLILIVVLHLRAPVLHRNWGSISQAILYHQVRKYLLLLDSRKDHVKFWRPQILLLVSDPRFSCPLLDFVNDLKKSGLYILGHVLVDEYSGENSDPALLAYPKWQTLVDHLKIKAFIEVTMAPSVRKGVQQLSRIAGLGAMKPNTVILGFHDEASCQNFFVSECSPFYVQLDMESSAGGSENSGKRLQTALTLRHWTEGSHGMGKLEPTEFVCIIRDLLSMGKNVCLCRHFQLLDKQTLLGRSNVKYFIDVWPMNFFDLNELSKDNKTSLFCLQMATVLNMVPSWHKKTVLRVFLCVCSSDPDDLKKVKSMVFKLLKELRIKATIVVLSLDNVNLLRKWSSEDNFNASTSGFSTPFTSVPLHQLPESYLKEVNLLVRENSIHTAVTFITLPPPPINPSHDACYLHGLTAITQNLPPTVLVHGLSSVTDSDI